MSFARKLHDLRIAQKRSLQDVGDAVGVSKAHVWNLEKGTTANPSMELVLKLAEYFRVRVADLVGDSPDTGDESPEMIAMFRDLKQLDERDRETIRLLMDSMKKSRDKRD
ncbi:helix-turn-helix domain-containing protein [Novosphingobium olei]|nr:helix-turn-helix domain-containing protein [Novosphingobium olei]